MQAGRKSKTTRKLLVKEFSLPKKDLRRILFKNQKRQKKATGVTSSRMRPEPPSEVSCKRKTGQNRKMNSPQTTVCTQMSNRLASNCQTSDIQLLAGKLPGHYSDLTRCIGSRQVETELTGGSLSTFLDTMQSNYNILGLKSPDR